MRLTLREPGGDLTPELLIDVLSMVGVHPDIQHVRLWSKIERLIAYDWAWREHLSASDQPVRRREKPWFVDSYGVLTTEDLLR